MNINNVKLAISVGFLSQLPAPLPEIVFVGRSNVGKSSLINCILKRKGLARISSSPGKTTTINFYDIDGQVYFVDLPGYGYAKRSFEDRKRWGELIDGYFQKGRDIRLILSLIDIRHAPTADDMTMLSWLGTQGYPYLIAATKSDKLSAQQVENRLSALRREGNIPADIPIIAFSSVKGTGRDTLLTAIQSAVNA